MLVLPTTQPTSPSTSPPSSYTQLVGNTVQLPASSNRLRTAFPTGILFCCCCCFSLVFVRQSSRILARASSTEREVSHAEWTTWWKSGRRSHPPRAVELGMQFCFLQSREKTGLPRRRRNTKTKTLNTNTKTFVEHTSRLRFGSTKMLTLEALPADLASLVLTSWLIDTACTYM